MAKNKPTTPKHGYGFAEKQRYRESVWDVFAEKLDPENAVVVFLPSKEGHEIPLALNRGFKEENLIAIDDCPAVIAASKWRKQYPKVKFYGNSISRAAQRIKKDGISVDAANLDLCGNISMQMIDEFKGFMLSGCLSGEAVISLTMLCGRESTATNTLAELYLKSIGNKYKLRFNKRIQVLISTAHKESIETKNDLFFKYESEDFYRSGTQKMTYGVFSVVGKSKIKDLVDEFTLSVIGKLEKYCKVKKECSALLHRSRTGCVFLLNPTKKDWVSEKRIRMLNDIKRTKQWLDEEMLTFEKKMAGFGIFLNKRLFVAWDGDYKTDLWQTYFSKKP